MKRDGHCEIVPAVARVGLPHVLLELGLERSQREIEVRGLADRRGGAGDLALRVDELGGVQERTALLALIPTGVRVAADRAGPLDVAVREEHLRLLVVELLLLFLLEETVGMEPEEELLRRAVVDRPGGPGIVVKAHPEPLEGGAVELVVAVDDLLRRDLLLLGRDRDRHTVLVGTTHEDDVALPGALEPDIDVRGEIGSGEVTEVDLPVGIREGRGDENALVCGAHDACRGRLYGCVVEDRLWRAPLEARARPLSGREDGAPQFGGVCPRHLRPRQCAVPIHQPVATRRLERINKLSRAESSHIN